jgi:hypothetical protein
MILKQISKGDNKILKELKAKNKDLLKLKTHS